jgi:hypothetical protein
MHAGIPGRAQAVSLRKAARDWHLNALEFCALVQAVRRGELVASRIEAGASALGVLMLDVNAAKALVAAMRRRTLPTMSVNEAARMLGLKQQVVYGLVRTGLLQSHVDSADRRCEATKDGLKKSRSARRVHSDDIARFHITYVALAEIARGCKQGPRAWMQGSTLVPVCGPTLNGVRQYFYRRCEVDAWNAATKASRTA